MGETRRQRRGSSERPSDGTAVVLVDLTEEARWQRFGGSKWATASGRTSTMAPECHGARGQGKARWPAGAGAARL